MKSLTVFVPTKLVNPLNSREFWATRAKRAKAQREAVTMAVYYALNGGTDRLSALRRVHISAKPSTPKRITFLAHVARKMDSDGLQASLKSIRDGLIDCGLINNDDPDSGHTFEYHQVVATPLGVTVTIECL